jgi:glutaredoxin
VSNFRDEQGTLGCRCRHTTIYRMMAPMNSSVPFLRLAAAFLVLGGASLGALAQYKVVGPDGSVTYTDKPPPASMARAANGSGGMQSPDASGGNGGGGALPYATRQATSRYPVTLYAAKACGACDSARQWLRGHAVPFNEYSLDNNADMVQLRQRFGDLTLPVVTIGSQTLKGFSTADLQSYTDAAGYPKGASLGNYRWPAAVPLAPVAVAAPATSASTPAPSVPSVSLPPPSKSGIQF